MHFIIELPRNDKAHKNKILVLFIISKLSQDLQNFILYSSFKHTDIKHQKILSVRLYNCTLTKQKMSESVIEADTFSLKRQCSTITAILERIK